MTFLGFIQCLEFFLFIFLKIQFLAFNLVMFYYLGKRIKSIETILVTRRFPDDGPANAGYWVKWNRKNINLSDNLYYKSGLNLNLKSISRYLRFIFIWVDPTAQITPQNFVSRPKLSFLHLTAEIDLLLNPRSRLKLPLTRNLSLCLSNGHTPLQSPKSLSLSQTHPQISLSHGSMFRDKQRDGMFPLCTIPANFTPPLSLSLNLFIP